MSHGSEGMNTRSCRAFLVVAAWLGAYAVADVIYVPSDYLTIQEGADAALEGDVVLVADGVYFGAGNRKIRFGGKAITVCSENGPANCIIDCGYLGVGFMFDNDEGPGSVVRGFTITNGYS